MKATKHQAGFTLVELSIVLAIVGLLMAGGMTLLSSSNDTARYKETQNQLIEVKEALTNYYIQFGRLPCPDAGVDGLEETTCASGASLRGFLPHVTLGLGGNGDAWGERLKYVVSPKFTPAITPPVQPSLCADTNPRAISPSTDQVTIQDLQTTGQTMADFAAFAIISTGKNGRQTNAGMTGAFSNDGGCASLSSLERENCDADSILRSGLPRADSNTITFDDMVVWGSDMQLIGLLRKSGACVGVVSNNSNSNNSNSNNTSPSSPSADSGGGCSVAHSGNDFGLLVLACAALIGIWFKQHSPTST